MSATAARPTSETEYGPAPDRSLEQRMDALVRANDIRSRRAVLKRDLKTGRGSVAGVLLDPPWWVESMKAFELVLAAPRYGRVKASKRLGECRISLSKTVGGLSERQRGELAMVVSGGRPVAMSRPRPVREPVDYLTVPL